MRDSPFKIAQYTLATFPLLFVLHGDIHTLLEQQKSIETLVRQVLVRVDDRELGDEGCPVADYEQILATAEEEQ